MYQRSLTTPSPLYWLGLDLGQAQDFTALAIIQKANYERTTDCHVRHLQRWPLHTSYPDIVDDVTKLLQHPTFAKARGVYLAIDGTGAGKPVVDMFRRARLQTGDAQSVRLRAIQFTAGNTVTTDGDVTNVPKRDLVGAVQTELQTGRLKVAASLPEAVTLQRELQNFRIKFTKAGNDTYEHWRESDHDDLVFAVAMPLWLAQNTGVGVHV
jgi:hypothetical protein